MLTYDLTKYGRIPLYDALYRSIRDDILSGAIKPGEMLPSKRSLADHLQISKVTVENAYAQLLAEGYIKARERIGCFAEAVEERPSFPTEKPVQFFGPAVQKSDSLYPASTLNRIMRSVISGSAAFGPTDGRGAVELRSAISGYLYRMRGMTVSPEQIVVGAGSEYLYQLLINLLGKDLVWAVENPGYGKVREILKINGLRLKYIDMDENGVKPSLLFSSGAQVLHITPSHHFPTGIVTPVQRRQEILKWAQNRGYIIEDDYDSEFRFSGRPIPTLKSADSGGRVIYLNTFSKTISPALRVSYMVLPPKMMEKYQQLLGFYASTVPAAEQFTLARFIGEGHFERHLARMKTHYKKVREALMSEIKATCLSEISEIKGDGSGLHFLLKINSEITDDALRKMTAGIPGITCLSDYFTEKDSAPESTLVINYSGVSEKSAAEMIRELKKRIK